MKTYFTKLMLYAATTALLFSCTSDEDALLPDGIMKRSVLTYYSNGEIISWIAKSYENNRVMVDSAFRTNAGLVAVVDYTYLDDRVSVIKEDYLFAGLKFTKNFTYDEFGRIVTIDIVEENSSVNFEYTATKIISKRFSEGSLTEQKNYILDLEENIIVETGIFSRIEATYSDDNLVINKTRNPREYNQEPIDYTYDQTNFPPTDFKFFQENLFGDYKNNGVLYDGTLNNIATISEITNRVFIVSEFRGGQTVNIERNFNNAGYPTERKFIINGNLQSLTEYFYN